MDSVRPEPSVVYLMEEWYWVLSLFVFLALAYYYLWLPKNWKKVLEHTILSWLFNRLALDLIIL